MHGEHLTAGDIARLFKLKVDTIYSLIPKEGLPAAKVGGKWRFDEAAVRSWFNERSKPVRVAPACDRTESCHDTRE